MCNKQKYSTKNDKSYDITILIKSNEPNLLFLSLLYIYLYISSFWSDNYNKPPYIGAEHID